VKREALAELSLKAPFGPIPNSPTCVESYEFEVMPMLRVAQPAVRQHLTEPGRRRRRQRAAARPSSDVEAVAEPAAGEPASSDQSWPVTLHMDDDQQVSCPEALSPGCSLEAYMSLPSEHYTLLRARPAAGSPGPAPDTTNAAAAAQRCRSELSWLGGQARRRRTASSR
jgi:hypothetical protein